MISRDVLWKGIIEFGFALEVARRALDERKQDDGRLMVSKLDMLRHLLTRGLDKLRIRRLYNFITYYTAFQNLENKLKFENEVQKITKSRKACVVWILFKN